MSTPEANFTRPVLAVPLIYGRGGSPFDAGMNATLPLALTRRHRINPAVPPLHDGETGRAADQQEGTALLNDIDGFRGVRISKWLIGHSRLPVVSPLLNPGTVLTRSK